MGKRKVSRNSNPNNKQTTVNYIMPARDRALTEGMYQMLNLITSSGSSPRVVEKALEIYKSYVNESETQEIVKKLEEEAFAKRDALRKQREDAIEYGKLVEDEVVRRLELIPEDGIEFGEGRYKLTKEGYILSKAKGWGKMALEEYHRSAIINEREALWMDYVTTSKLNIDGISVRVSHTLLVIRITDCLRKGEPVTLSHNEIKS